MTTSPGRLLVLLLLGLAACVSVGVLVYMVVGPSIGLLGEPADPGAAVFTQAAKTLEVQLTSLAAAAQSTTSAYSPTPIPSRTPELPTFTPRPTNTPLPIASSTPVNTPTSIAQVTRTSISGGGSTVRTPGAPVTPGTICNAARFVEDVTLPDESEVSPGAGFTKTWRVQNTGFCPWTTAYSLEFVDGDQMGAPEKITIPETVEPGESVDLSVNFIAPTVSGTYESYWKLSDQSGNLFGVGASADRSIWVIIEVSEGGSGGALDFVGSACAADWESGAGNLSCPGEDNEPTGFVYTTNTPELETRNEDEPAIVVHPEMKNNGYITGTYPPFLVKEGDFFQADIGCMAESDDCNVIFQLSYRTENGNVRKIGEWQERSDDLVTTLSLDLTDLAGKRVEFILTVLANGSDNDDNAFWFLPHIERDE